MLDDDLILERLTRVFRDFFDDPDIRLLPHTTASEVDGWDSVATVALMVAIEREFGIRFLTGDVAGLADLGQLCGRIRERLHR